MDEAVNIARHVLAGVALLAVQLAAQAQALQDPTRPPANLAAYAGAQAVSSGPQLQSVLISREPGGRHIAVIDGETVRLGEQFQGARLVRVTQTEVELLRGRQRQVLKLNSSVAGNGRRSGLEEEQK
ncbi:hypothetical protein [Massilia horti]|uniref:MSHA biogenesis protein MshK n=1 Tax=Massilia horti TaxID=2562153 RepID=A0A4Y9T0F9_9BURK|nr:hypothetical protein [Massilia horti]TFW30978.1 hypothetical protein E4O92_14815 [Massilia horti]